MTQRRRERRTFTTGRRITGQSSGDGHAKAQPEAMASTEEPQNTLQHGSFQDRETADRFHLSLSNRFQALQEVYEASNTNLDAKCKHAKRM